MEYHVSIHGSDQGKEQRINPFAPYHALRLMPWLVIPLLFMREYTENGLTRRMEERRSIESSIDPQETARSSLQELSGLLTGSLKERTFGAPKCLIPFFRS